MAVAIPHPLELTAALVARPSVTPDDAGCQQLVADYLESAGFTIEHLPIGEVKNLLAWHGDGDPGLVFLGHTDVVPPGPMEQWESPPFEPAVREGRLYGRGTADMKGSVAAMVCALMRTAQDYPAHRGTVSLLLTSDEEGPSVDGIRKVAPALSQRGFPMNYCVVGEPSSLRRLGDNIRIGRRGSLNIRFTVRGKQGHAAYPDLAANPIHAVAPVLAQLASTTWDEGNEAFPPTSFQITDLHSGEGVFNVIPGVLVGKCNFRYSPESTAQALIDRVHALFARSGLPYELETQDSGRPFQTAPGPLIEAAATACLEELGVEPVRDTGGGTSDGRFMAPQGADVVELGPVNASIHKVNEWIDVEAPRQLDQIYSRIIRKLLIDAS